MQSKAGTYLGFCRRAGKLTLGVNAARATRERIFLFVCDPSAAENCKKEIAKLCEKFDCPVVWLDNLAALVNKAECKVAGVREEHLAEAIRRASEEGNFQK